MEQDQEEYTRFLDEVEKELQQQKPRTNQETMLDDWRNPANLARRLVSYDEDSRDWVIVNGNGVFIAHRPKFNDAIQFAITWLLSPAEDEK